MPNLRYVIRTSDHPAARAIRSGVRGARGFALPVPRAVVLPIVKLFLALRTTYYWVWRVFVCEPFFKAQCARCGSGVHTGNFLHYILGVGDIVLGDRVKVDGKSNFVFASTLPERPVLEIGEGTYVNHACTFIVARRITIGRDVMLAAGVTIFDSPGHPLDAERRIAGLPPDPDDIRQVVIGDKAWIGSGVRIFPGVTIGEGAVVGMDSLVTKDVPPYTLVAGVPAKPIRTLRPGVDELPVAAREGRVPDMTPA
jgi:acetyltransferase-like isoleucine patch superfamily enzyme